MTTSDGADTVTQRPSSAVDTGTPTENRQEAVPDSKEAAPAPSITEKKNDTQGDRKSSDESDQSSLINLPDVGNSKRSQEGTVTGGESDVETVNRSSTPSVCLCQPEPKIPRPRNAFILYRQHHQARVVAENPGVTNPDISKVIARYWRAEPDAVRNKWKLISEEEKVRHHTQYPDYRYQPRRAAVRGGIRRSSTTSATPTTFENNCCMKCGGRSAALANDSHSGPISTSFLVPRTPVSAVTPAGRILPRMNNLGQTSPMLRRQQIPMSAGQGPRPTQSWTFPKREADVSLSPESKRRRLNVGAHPSPSNAPPFKSPYLFSHSPMSREVLPSQMEMPFRNTPRVQGQLAAPPRPQQANHSQRTFNLAGLAPLQTRIDNGSAVEAMVMGMPVLDKIKLLSEISPPIKSVSPTSPKSLKGTLIAIEGEDDSSIMVCGLFLADILQRASECEVKSVEGPFIPAKGRGEVTIKDYLRVISDWHLTGAEVEKFLSTPRSPIKAPAAENEEQKSTVTERTVVPVPVAIIANYQLRTSNKFASCIPINDAYSPAFHWQWMATLWRGIIGPDLTIYIKNCGPEELSAERNVEIRDGYRCIVVRKDGEVKEIDDRTLRRLAFEVGEWVRNLAYGKSGTL